jgi:MFS family permease
MSFDTTSVPFPRVAVARPAINPWVIAITVTLATFMELLDTAIANVSLPHIAGGLAVSYDESTWVLTSYLVSNAVVLPLSAWLSRVFGRKRYYMLCVLLFTVSMFGSTVLIPQILQNLYGYTATDAGLVLGPGAFVIVVLAPLVVRIFPKIGVKPMINLRLRRLRRRHVALRQHRSWYGLQARRSS